MGSKRLTHPAYMHVLSVVPSFYKDCVSVGSKRIAGGTGPVVFVRTVATRRRTYNLQCTYTEETCPTFKSSQ